MNEALKIEAAWKRKCSAEAIFVRQDGYQQVYNNFVRKESATFADSVQYFMDAKALAHTLESYGADAEFQDWYLAHGDFLSGAATPFTCITAMNQMAVLIVKLMKGFHSKTDVKVVLIEALKFCVTRFDLPIPWL